MAKILVVDDSEKLRKLVHVILSQEDHSVLQAKDAFQAEDMLNKYNVDLVLLDVNMPYKDGFAALKSLRATYRFRLLPVVFMTARNSKRDIERAIELDAAGYIVKPIVPKELVSKVNSVLTNHRVRSLDIKVNKGSVYSNVKMKVTLEGHITKISDIGIEMDTSVVLDESQEVVVNSALFTKIGIDPPSMKIISVKPDPVEGAQVKLIYQGLSEEEMHTLRTWLNQENPMLKLAS